MEDKFEGMEPRQIIKKTRHKAELWLKCIAIILSCLLFIAVGLVAETARTDTETRAEIESFFNEEDEVETSILNVLLSLGIGCSLVAVAGMILFLLYTFYSQYAQTMAYSVKVTPVNFPEIYARAADFTKQLGLKKQPEVYIEQQNGILNAFSTYVLGKRYVSINAELVDVAYLENKDFDTVFFVMAHEFGHIYLGHVTLRYNLFTLLARIIPVFGPLLSRAQEYSADRVAQALTDNTNSAECMALLTVGRHLYKHMDVNDYLQSAEANHNFLERLSRFVVNMMATHPITPFRVKAIMDPERRSGRLL